MCGIVGYITTRLDSYENARRGFFKYALMLDTLRGPDSTGVITVSKKFTVNRYKTLSSGFRMATSEVFEKEVPNGWCAIGHNRSATSGEVVVGNAHPFKFGKISLVHNGTLSQAGASLPTFDKDLVVDSMQIAKALSTVPAKEATAMLDHIDGDFAIVWTDERDRSINMARNRGRPLHLGFNFDRTFMCFMSDDDHLRVLTKAFAGTSAHIPTIYSIDSFQHLKWKRGNLRPEVADFRPFTRKFPVTNRDYHPGFPTPSNNTKQTTTDTRSSKTKSSGTTSTEKSGSSPNEKAILKKLTVKPKSSTPKRGVKARWDAKRKRLAAEQAKGKSCGTTEQVSGKGLLINRMISPYEGVVPKSNTLAMVESLESFFCVNPTMLTSFKPEDFYELTPNLYQVVGSVIAQGWGDVDWEGCINFVSAKQVEAYASKKWLVRAIGLTRNRSVPGCPAVLCELIHCDYAKYEASCDDKQSEANQLQAKELDSIGGLVKDPSGRLINREQLQINIDKGCINCGCMLDINDSYLYQLVNNDIDIICESCKWEMKWPLAE